MWNKPLDKRMINATYKVGPASYKWSYNSTYRGCFYRYAEIWANISWGHLGSLFVRSLVKKASAIQDGKMEPRINMTMKQYETPVDLVDSQ